MLMKTVFTGIRDFIEYERFLYQDKRAMGLISAWELPAFLAILSIITSFIIYIAVEYHQMEKDYQSKMRKIEYQYMEMQKKQNLNDVSFRRKYRIHESTTGCSKWGILYDRRDRIR